MHKDCMNKTKKCKKYYDLDGCHCEKEYKKDKGANLKMSPMFVYPVDLCNCEIFHILCNCIGRVVGLKLVDNNCILRLFICDVNSCGVVGKTPSGKGPIYVKLNAIQYIDFGKETYVNPLCGTSLSIGVQVPKGEMGPMGPTGSKGAKGEMGPMGPAGSKGAKGEMGSMGPTGSKGEIGPMGPAGSKGEMGPMGPAGPKGEMGSMGPVGPKGSKGEMGSMGPAGPKGEMGPMGPSGPKGEMGLMGPSGPKGAKGEMGPMGPTGYEAPGKKVKEKYMPPKKIPYKN